MTEHDTSTDRADPNFVIDLGRSAATGAAGRLVGGAVLAGHGIVLTSVLRGEPTMPDVVSCAASPASLLGQTGFFRFSPLRHRRCDQ